jgi:hypothetical protein
MKRHVNCTICLALLAISFAVPAVSQSTDNADQPDNVELSLGTVRTEAEAAAVKLLARYAEGLPEIFLSSAGRASVDKGWILDLSPEVSIETGDKDSFNGVIAKMTGNFMRIRLKPLEGLPEKVADTEKLIHVAPISFGFEGDRNFDSVATLLETGYIPLLIPKGLGFQHKIGVFLQAGYKFDANEEGEPETGGAQDQSAEEEDSSILRLKGRAGTQLCLLGQRKGCLHELANDKWGISFILDAAGWYDIANEKTYHSIDARLRLTLLEDRHFDLKYQDGSGAPNFNEGEEFSANLTVNF